MGNKWGAEYVVASPNEFVVLTGFGISSIRLSKAAMKWPGQIANRIDVSPQNYEFSLHAMSSEKLLFLLPGVFTIGPHLNPNNEKENIENLEKYATFFGCSSRDMQHATILGMIEGEVRALCATLTLEKIFNDRVAFKKRIIDAIQMELDQFGLKIFNANIKELEDTHGSEYFSYLRQKARSGAENDAKIAIAEAESKGAIGQSDKEANTKVTTTIINAKATMAENEQKSNVLSSNTDLQVAVIQNETHVKLLRVQQSADIEKRNLELEREVEEARQGKRLEELRATTGVEAEIQAEIIQTQANAEYYRDVKIADALLYEKSKEAEGITVLANARKKALEQYTKVFGDSNALLSYIMLEKGLFTEMATINSNAIKGLNPKITVWNTGAGGADADPYSSIRNIHQAMPPLISTIQHQTGITAPDQSTARRVK